MRTLYGSILDDDEVVMSRAIGSSFRFSIERMLDSGVADKQLIRDLESTVAVYPVTDKNIKDIIIKYIKLTDDNCSLNWIDTSEVTNIAGLFSDNITIQFNGDISKWNVSIVRNMSYMFSGSEFNQDISNWDVSNVEGMTHMFSFAKFDRDISNWDVSNVRDMSYMFHGSKFNQDISKWDVKKARRSNGVFSYCLISPDYKPKFL